MKRLTKDILGVYFDIPTLAKKILPIVVLEHLVAAFCLNVSVYFKKVNGFGFEQIGLSISLYYWGCLLGALIGGMVTLQSRTNKISGFGMVAMSVCFYCLFFSSSRQLINLSMFSLGCIGTIVATSNITSLIRTALGREKVKLKVISLELILFNLSFSFVTYILLDLDAIHIVKFIEILMVLLVFFGLWTLTFHNESIFNPPQSKSSWNINFFPQHKQEFLVLMGMVFCFGLIFSMVKVIFTPTLVDRFGDNMVSVAVASVNPWMMFFIQPLIINRIKNTNSIWYLGLGGFTVGLSYFVFGVVNSFLFTVIALVVLTFGEMMFSPLSKHLSVQLYNEGQEGIASGAWRAVFLGSGVIGPELSGYVAEYYGEHFVWECCALLGVACFVFSVFSRKMKLKNLTGKVALEL